MTKGISFALILVCALLILPTANALAEEFVDPHWTESPTNFSVGFRVGMAFASSEDFQDIYGEKGVPYYSLEFGWKTVHELELHLEMGYWWDQGRGITEDGKQTNEKYKLHMAPVEVGLLYRFNFVYDQPVVPYLGVAGVYSYFLEERLDSSWKKRGGVWGVAGNGGFMILLDKAEKRAAGLMERDSGINSTYLIYNFKYSLLNDFDETSGLDLTNQQHTIGVLLEF